MRRRRAAAVVASATVAGVMIVGGLASACTVFLRIETVTPASTEPLTTAAVRGVGGPADSAVELRWNAVKGPVLARAQTDDAGAFHADVQVPNVPPGVYILIAGADGNVARAAIEVAPGSSGRPYTMAFAGRQESGPGQALQAGVVALASGLVILAAGALVVSTRRRRALATGTAGAQSHSHSGRRSDDLL